MNYNNIKLKHIYTNLLFETALPDKWDLKKMVSEQDVIEYYGNTPFALKIFKQWIKGSGEFKDAILFRGKVTGNYSKNNIKLGLRQIVGKTKNTIAYIYIPKTIYDKIII